MVLGLVAGIAVPGAAGADALASPNSLDGRDATEVVDLFGVPARTIDSNGLVSVDGLGLPEVDIASAAGNVFTFGLPATLAPTPFVVDSATSTLTAVDGTHAVVIEELGLNSFRAVIVMKNAEAPSEYRFDLGLPSGWTVAAATSGEVIVSNNNGGEVGRVALPWADDANGTAMDTRFEVVGTSIVQTINTDGATFPVVADPSFQGDCGTVTCTVRLDRAQTKNARDASQLVGAAATICGVLSGGTLAIVCGAAILPASIVLATFAGRYYGDGNCLGIRFNKYPVPPLVTFVGWPTQVKYGEYNCK
ncbi:MAG: hypothetical protein EXQ71_03745 [Acidimicrobiia bacterium]|nr:hypothetical protein [Acidimicrobiia bacterium]